ncbi:MULTISPECIES: diacylglycerol kinase family protein [Cohnella]|uniref:diacylglycerol kinase family protein n=1 Tax=Cohnella TaxID=329857 RepID=UPI0009BADB70|nr:MULTISPECIES: diacylglycerol kinase family protein [Cohnella]MBN2983314.1 diacylglycerol kinase family protein [Cohnella algarum]
MSRKQSELSSFRNALAGIAHALRTEPHMRFHFGAGIAAFAAAALLRLPGGDWLWLLAAVAAVWTAELFNTAIERTVDLASPERHELAKAAKDAASGAVLVASLFAAAVGLIVLGPPLWLAVFGS